MNSDRIFIVFNDINKNEQTDIDVPLDISANELIAGLNHAFNLGLDISNMQHLHLKSENPIALLRGDKLLSDYRLRNGSIINYI